jgi:hypothetical protein
MAAKKTATQATLKHKRRRSPKRHEFRIITPALLISSPPTGTVVTSRRVQVTIQTDSPTLSFTLQLVDASGNVVSTIPINNANWTGDPPTQTVTVVLPVTPGATYTLWLEADDPLGVFANGIELSTP